MFFLIPSFINIEATCFLLICIWILAISLHSSILLFPILTCLSSSWKVIPLPLISLKFLILELSTFLLLIPIILLAIGWLLKLSPIKSISIISSLLYSSVKSSSFISIFVTLKVPLVKVPVLSNIIFFALLKLSK